MLDKAKLVFINDIIENNFQSLMPRKYSQSKKKP